MNIRFAPNTLYYGDCLEIMADFSDNSIDLICLDPPFNSEEYFRLGEQAENLLRLPALPNPWTGKEMQRTLFK